MLEEVSFLVTSDEERAILRRKCAEILQMQNIPASFFGAQPVSLQRKHLMANSNLEEQKDVEGNFKLSKKFYVVTEKTDGERFLLLVEGDRSYLLNRKMEFRRIQARFPLAPKHVRNGENSIKFVENTILDGELLREKSGRVVFLFFDCLAFNGERKLESPFIERLRIVQNEIIIPKFYFDGTREQIFFTLKDFYPIRNIDWLFNEYVPNLNHHSDGVIFNHLIEPYEFGKAPSILKWKPEEENTCDFAVGFEYRNDMPLLRLNIANGGVSTMLDDFLCGSYDENLLIQLKSSELQKPVVECFWDRTATRIIPSPEGKTWEEGARYAKGGWKCLRTRDDKKLPNDVVVMKNVISSIAECITKEEVTPCLPAMQC